MQVIPTAPFLQPVSLSFSTDRFESLAPPRSDEREDLPTQTLPPEIPRSKDLPKAKSVSWQDEKTVGVPRDVAAGCCGSNPPKHPGLVVPTKMISKMSPSGLFLCSF